eukprot:1970596-Alexandrium_andersonii.AAC.1
MSTSPSSSAPRGAEDAMRRSQPECALSATEPPQSSGAPRPPRAGQSGVTGSEHASVPIATPAGRSKSTGRAKKWVRERV